MNIVVIGGRGSGTVIVSAINDMTDMECVGFLNDFEKEIDRYPVLGSITKRGWQALDEDVFFISALTNAKSGDVRHLLLKGLEIPSNRFANVVHPIAHISSMSEIGYDVGIMPFASVGPDVKIGDHSKIFAQGFIGHDSELGEMCFVANNATIGGKVKMGDGVHVGSNSSILERVQIGQYAVIGLGAVVIRDVSPFDIVVGNPARVIGHNARKPYEKN